MTKKIFSLENLGEELSNDELDKLYGDLKKVNFFSKEESDFCDKKVLKILKRNPNLDDGINGQDYLLETLFKDGNPVSARIYDFNLKIRSTCC